MGSCISISPANASLFSDVPLLWQDRQIRWNQPGPTLQMRPGEMILQVWPDVEEVLGHIGQGRFVLSNLRLVWIMDEDLRHNISIGLTNVIYVHYNVVDSPKFGRVRASHVTAHYASSRFEFTFAVCSERSCDLFTSIDMILRRYRASRIFREIILRDATLMTGTTVKTHHGEQLLETSVECDNITADEIFPGFFYVTDKRVIWSASNQCVVNVSVPFIQINSIATRGSQFGPALVIEMCKTAIGCVLGFRFNDSTILANVGAQVVKLHGESHIHPFFGPLDGSVQYVDDRLVILPPPSSSTLESLEVLSRTQSVTLPTLASAETDRAVEQASLSPWPIRERQRVSLEQIYDFYVVSEEETTGSVLEKTEYRHTTTTCSGSPSSESPLLFEAPSQLSSCEALGLTATSPMIVPAREAVCQFCDNRECRSSYSPVVPNVSSSKTILQSLMKCPDFWNRLDSATRQRFIEALLQHQNFLLRDATRSDGKRLFLSEPSNPSMQHGACAEPSSSPSRDPLLLSCASNKKIHEPKCVVCMATMTEAAFDPCGHLCSCMECASQMKQCPICRGAVEKVLRIYLEAV